jgi:large subunit ribosomal protein L15
MGTTLATLSPPRGGGTTARKRLGRGPGSGLGKTSGRGYKGQGSRSGVTIKRDFEGGQMPLVRRLPKRGFRNVFRVEYEVVNLGALAAAFPAGARVGPEDLVARGLCHHSTAIKILGGGDLGHALQLRAHRFSAAARAKIEAAGGKAEEIKRP